MELSKTTSGNNKWTLTIFGIGSRDNYDKYVLLKVSQTNVSDINCCNKKVQDSKMSGEFDLFWNNITVYCRKRMRLD